MTFVRPIWTSPQAVASVLVIPPAVEPLTLDEAKLIAGLDWLSPDPRDAMLTSFVAAARQQVEADTGLALLTQTRDVIIAAGQTSLPIPWQASPVQSMTELVATPSGYVVGRPLPAAAYQDVGAWWTTAAPGGAWRIVAGWPDVDTLKSEAPLLIHAVGLLVAHYATLGRDAVVSGPGMPPPSAMVYGYAEAIAPYRLLVLV